jgi:branched-chain amino acid transport system substrate-binding protein
VLKTQAAFFKMVNDRGGINGRKINFISYDDAYSPPKTVEQTRKLVEGDQVLFVFGTLGTAPSAAIHKYMNREKVPQLLRRERSVTLERPEKLSVDDGHLAVVSQ